MGVMALCSVIVIGDEAVLDLSNQLLPIITQLGTLAIETQGMLICWCLCLETCILDMCHAAFDLLLLAIAAF